MDIGVILAATTQEPGFASWLGLKILAWVGVAAGLTFVIFVHELGHFLVAKACGVKCEKFYVGFDVPIGPDGARREFAIRNVRIRTAPTSNPRGTR